MDGFLDTEHPMVYGVIVKLILGNYEFLAEK